MGDARRIDEAFQLLESVELGTAVGNPQLSEALVCGLLNALIESGYNFHSKFEFSIYHSLLDLCNSFSNLNIALSLSN